MSDQIFDNEWVFDKAEGIYRFSQLRPKFYVNLPLKTPFGPRIGLNEQIPLRDIKQVTVEKKSFSMYGDMTRISLSVLRDKELTTTYLYPRFLPDNNAEKVANELNHFLGIEVV